MKESYEILPDEFNFNTIKPKKDKKRKRIIEDKKKKTKLALRMFSYVSSTVLTVTIVTGNVPFVEASSTVEENKPTINVEEIIDKDLVIDEAIEETVQEIIVEEEETVEEIIYKTVKCEKCDGQGIICPGDPDFGYSRGNGYGYEGCHGTGYSDCPDIWCRGSYKICQSCEGSGIEKNDPCEVCDGTGVVDCEFCYGTGIAECICLESHFTCSDCSGTGEITIEIINK